MVLDFMIELSLLVLILCGQAAVVWAIFELKWSFEAWTEAWGKNPLPASDYHANEIWKTLQEVAHFAAVEHLRKQKLEDTQRPPLYE